MDPPSASGSRTSNLVPIYLEPLFDVGEDALVPGVQHQLPHQALLTWSLCLMLEKMLWFQESSISFLTTLSSVNVFFATAVVVFPYKKSIERKDKKIWNDSGTGNFGVRIRDYLLREILYLNCRVCFRYLLNILKYL